MSALGSVVRFSLQTLPSQTLEQMSVHSDRTAGTNTYFDIYLTRKYNCVLLAWSCGLILYTDLVRGLRLLHTQLVCDSNKDVELRDVYNTVELPSATL